MASPTETLPVPAPSVDEFPNAENNQKARASAHEGIIDQVYTGTAEETFKESSFHPDSLRRPYNPDPLVMKDWTYRIYEEMLQDDQVSVCMQIKKDLVVGSGFDFEEGEDGQEDVVADLGIAFEEQADRPFSDICEDILQAYEFGFSVSEKIFKNRDDGTLCLKDCKPRHPSTWLLHTDPKGNMEKYEQRALRESIDVNPDSLVHYINNPKFQNPYGRSDLFPAFQAYMTKRHITRFYAIFLEKAASPTPVAKYDRRAPQEAIDNVFEAIKKFQTRTAMTIPKEFEVEFLESKSSGEAYIKGINMFNMFIGRALFIPDLLGFQGSETGGGSYALGKDQIGMFLRHVYRRRDILERLINMHFVRPICMYNHGMTEKFPKFKFNPLSDEEAQSQAKLWADAMRFKVWKPTIEEVNRFRTIIDFPTSDTLELVETPPPGGDVPRGTKDGADGGVGADGWTGNQEDGQGAAPDPAKGEADKKDAAKAKKKFQADIASLPGTYKKKVDFNAADQTLRATVQRIVHECQPIVDDIYEDLYDQIQKKKIIPNQNLERADSINLKYLKKLQLVFKRNFRRLYGDAQVSARAEIGKKEYATNVPNDEFLDFLDQETFKYIGDWEYSLTTKVKQELIAAIKDGKPLSEVIGIMDDEGRDLSDVSIERYARTKTTEVFNRGRMEYFDSTGVVVAYQYAAILDDRTSDICEGLNGCIFDKGDEPVPPMHFNCRSILIPITQYEDYEASDESNDGTDIDQFIEDNKGKGFPTN